MVMPMQITINGVPGPIQNIQQALPMPRNHSLLVIKYRRYITHTSLLTTMTVAANITAVFQSLILTHIHLKGKEMKYHIHFQNLFHLLGSFLISFLHISFEMSNSRFNSLKLFIYKLPCSLLQPDEVWGR